MLRHSRLRCSPTAVVRKQTSARHRETTPPVMTPIPTSPLSMLHKRLHLVIDDVVKDVMDAGHDEIDLLFATHWESRKSVVCKSKKAMKGTNSKAREAEGIAPSLMPEIDRLEEHDLDFAPSANPSGGIGSFAHTFTEVFLNDVQVAVAPRQIFSSIPSDVLCQGNLMSTASSRTILDVALEENYVKGKAATLMGLLVVAYGERKVQAPTSLKATWPTTGSRRTGTEPAAPPPAPDDDEDLTLDDLISRKSKPESKVLPVAQSDDSSTTVSLEWEEVFLLKLKKAMHKLPLTSNDTIYDAGKCSQMQLLAAVSRTIDAVDERAIRALSVHRNNDDDDEEVVILKMPSTSKGKSAAAGLWGLTVEDLNRVRRCCERLRRSVFQHEMVTSRALAVFRGSVANTSLLTHTVLRLVVQRLHHPRRAVPGKEDSEDISLERKRISTRHVAAMDVLRLFRKAFIESGVAITSFGEAVTWLDGVPAVIDLFTALVRAKHDAQISTGEGKRRYRWEPSVDEALLNEVRTTAAALFRWGSADERRSFVEERVMAQFAPELSSSKDGETAADEAQQQSVVALLRARRTRSLFSSGAEKNGTKDASASGDKSRFSKRLQQMGGPAAPPAVTTTSTASNDISSPLVTLFRRSEQSVADEVAHHVQSMIFSSGRHTLQRTDDIVDELARVTHELWLLLEEGIVTLPTAGEGCDMQSFVRALAEDLEHLCITVLHAMLRAVQVSLRSVGDSTEGKGRDKNKLMRVAAKLSTSLSKLQGNCFHDVDFNSRVASIVFDVPRQKTKGVAIPSPWELFFPQQHHESDNDVLQLVHKATPPAVFSPSTTHVDILQRAQIVLLLRDQSNARMPRLSVTQAADFLPTLQNISNCLLGEKWRDATCGLSTVSDIASISVRYLATCLGAIELLEPNPNVIITQVARMVQHSLGLLTADGNEDVLVLACRADVFPALYAIVGTRGRFPRQGPLGPYVPDELYHAIEEQAARFMQKAFHVWVPIACEELLQSHHRPLPDRSGVVPDEGSGFVRLDEYHLRMSLIALQTAASVRLPVFQLFRDSPLMHSMILYCGRVLSNVPLSREEVTLACEELSTALQQFDVKQRQSGDKRGGDGAVQRKAVIASLARHGVSSVLALLAQHGSYHLASRSAVVDRAIATAAALDRYSSQRHFEALFPQSHHTAQRTAPLTVQRCRLELTSIGNDDLLKAFLLSTSITGPPCRSKPLAFAGGSESVASRLPALFPSDSSDVPALELIAIGVECTHNVTSFVADSKRLSLLQLDCRVCFELLRKGKGSGWSLLIRTLEVDRAIRSRLNVYPNTLLQHRTACVLQLLQRTSPISIRRQVIFPDLCVLFEEYICAATPMTLLGIVRDSPRTSSGELSFSAKLLHANFFGVKQIVNQLTAFENELNDVYTSALDDSPGSKARDDDDGDDDDVAARGRRGKRRIQPTDVQVYVALQRRFSESLIAVTDLIVDSLRTHAFQRTLDESMRLLLNYCLLTCCQIIRRLAKGEGSTSAAVQSACGTLHRLDYRGGIDGVNALALTAVASFLAVLVTSDARNNYLQPTTRNVVHATLRDVFVFVSRVRQEARSEPRKHSGSIYETIKEFALGCSKKLRIRVGFVQKRRSMGVENVWESLLSLSLTATLPRHSTLPALTVHTLLSWVKEELCDPPLLAKDRIAADLAQVAQRSVASFQGDLVAIEGRVADDLVKAHAEKAQLEQKEKSMSSALKGLREKTKETTVAERGDAAAASAEVTLTVEEKGCHEDGNPNSENRVTVVVDSAYVKAKIATLEVLSHLNFAFDDKSLGVLKALATRTEQDVEKDAVESFEHTLQHLKKVRIQEGEEGDDDEAALEALSPEEAQRLRTLKVEASKSSKASSQEKSCAASSALTRFAALFMSSKRRFRASSTHSRRDALSEELITEFAKLLGTFGLRTLCEGRPGLLARVLKVLRMSKRLPQCEAVCKLLAEELRNSYNVPSSAAFDAKLRHCTETQKSLMREAKEDPISAVAQSVAGGLCVGDDTRYQAEEDLTTAEALASRHLYPSSRSEAHYYRRGAQSREIWFGVGKLPKFSDPTTSQLVEDDGPILPVCVLFALANELQRLERGPSAGLLADEVALYAARHHSLLLKRVGPSSTVYEYASAVSFRYDSDECEYWRTVIGEDICPPFPELIAMPPSNNTNNKEIVAVKSVKDEAIVTQQVVRNVGLLLLLQCTVVGALSRHSRIGTMFDRHTQFTRVMKKLRKSPIDVQRERARARFCVLTDCNMIQSELFEMFLIATKHMIVKMLLLSDLQSFQAQTGKTSKSFASEIRVCAAKFVVLAMQQIVKDLPTYYVKQVLPSTLSPFQALPRGDAVREAVSIARFTASSTDTQQQKPIATVPAEELMFSVSCPTLYECFDLTTINEILPKIVDEASVPFSATVASVLTLKLIESPPIPLSNIVNCTCVLVNSTLRRSNAVTMLLLHLCHFVIHEADLKDREISRLLSTTAATPDAASDTDRNAMLPMSSQTDMANKGVNRILSEEDAAMFAATIARDDSQIPRDVFVKTVTHIFSKRRDVFGDPPPIVEKINKMGLGQALQRQQSRTPATASRGLAHEGSQPSTSIFNRSDILPSSSPMDDMDQDEYDPTQPHGGGEFASYSIFGSTADSPDTHAEALRSLNFRIEQMFVLMTAHATRARLKFEERQEGRGLIRAAMAERQEKISRMAMSVGGGSKLVDLSLTFRDPLNYPVAMLHCEFALRKIIHAAARKLGIVQAPHTVADLVELLHSSEDFWREKNVTDGVLNGTLQVLLDWALLRVEDAGCDGVEDRNQFVTPSARRFGDSALRHVKKWREDKERRRLFYESKNAQRQWRVKGDRQQHPATKSRGK